MQSMGVWSLNLTKQHHSGSAIPKNPPLTSRDISVRVHPYAHPQHFKALKHFVYMLLPICAQFHYAYGDPHMQTF